jgi:hypothetical protein
MPTNEWVRLPSSWIDKRGLSRFSWRYGGAGSDNTAALMVLTVIAHNADAETGVAQATYDRICNDTGLSRAKVSNGLDVLQRIKVITTRPQDARSTYALTGYDPAIGWAKFPVKSMYSQGRIIAFDEFRLRKVVELDALKLFFLFVARRGRDTNLANIGYEKIEDYTNIRRVRIKSAISFLASLSLVYVEHVPSQSNSHGVSNCYRIVGIEPYRHMGTRGRNPVESNLE